MAESKLPNEQQKGQPILASHLTAVYKFVKAHEQNVEGFISGAFRVTRPKSARQGIEVYELVNCDDVTQKLYSDNAEIAEHVGSDAPVAVVKKNGVVSCWQVIGIAPKCTTGECIEIIGWLVDCSQCEGACFELVPCGTGDTIIVEGVEWSEYIGKIVLIDAGDGRKCYTVGIAENCDNVDPSITPDQIIQVYEDCGACGCYRLKLCHTTYEIWVDDDLAGLYGLPDGSLIVGGLIRVKGKCYEIMEFQNPCTQETISLGLESAPEVIEDCNECCFLLTPCSGFPGSAFKVKPSELDTVDLADFIDDNGDSNGRAIMLAAPVNYNCYTVSISPDCVSAQNGLGTVYEVFDDCASCGLTCWKECGNSTPANYLATYSNLEQYKDTRYALKRAEDGKCYTYESSFGSCVSAPVDTFTVEEVFEDATNACQLCLQPKYKLIPDCGNEGCTDCSGSSSGGSSSSSGATPIITDDPTFATMVGQYIKYDGTCYRIETTTEPLNGSVGCYTGPFETCSACALADTKIKLVGVKDDGEIVGFEVQGALMVCGSFGVTEDCPDEESSSISPNSYAYTSLI